LARRRADAVDIELGRYDAKKSSIAGSMRCGANDVAARNGHATVR
jgi:hypothetical protein